MTQSDLAKKMNVTDKAVSKWERNLSCPDINSIPQLAESLDVSVEELLNIQKKSKFKNNQFNEVIDLVLIAVGLAMGIGLIVLSILEKIDMFSAFKLLGLGLSSISFYLLRSKEKKHLEIK